MEGPTGDHRQPRIDGQGRERRPRLHALCDDPSRLQPAAGLLLSLQRRCGNRVVARLTASGTPGQTPIQRRLSIKTTAVEPTFKLPLAGRRRATGLLETLQHSLAGYYGVVDAPGTDVADLLGIVQAVWSAAQSMPDYLKMEDYDDPEKSPVMAFRLVLNELNRQCSTEVATLKRLVLRAHPGAVLPGKGAGSGSTGEVQEVTGQANMLYKADKGIFAGDGAAKSVGLAGKPASPRAVASHRLDVLLGTGVLGTAALAVSAEGGRGHVMDLAKGTPLKDIDETRRSDIFKKPFAKKALYNLQTLDALTGEADRNSGNIMVDEPSGKVTGIDNETAFSPTKSSKDIEDVVISAETRLKRILPFANRFTGDRFKNQWEQHRSTGGILHMALPAYMDEAVATHIVDVLTPERVCDEVKDLLGPDELVILAKNFDRLQRHAGGLLADHLMDPTTSRIIPSGSAGEWDRVPSTPGRNYFYEKG